MEAVELQGDKRPRVKVESCGTGNNMDDRTATKQDTVASDDPDETEQEYPLRGLQQIQEKEISAIVNSTLEII
jgi:hypothetical protein